MIAMSSTKNEEVIITPGVAEAVLRAAGRFGNRTELPWEEYVITGATPASV